MGQFSVAAVGHFYIAANNITNFLKELRRRNVFKVGVAYVIVAWLLLQFTDIAAPAMHLPEWTISFITYLLIIGFPLILLFTWAFELTPEGVKPTHHVELDESIKMCSLCFSISTEAGSSTSNSAGSTFFSNK